jgi:response regulator RpfG family c-di-GMP phosphodiesterase
MAEQILLVDDEPKLLDGLRRSLHGHHRVDTAASGADGLARIAGAADPYRVVVSDMMMPGMNGAEFLARARTASPDSILMILSGQADLSSTIAAVNSANLFRFLTKPCAAEEFGQALDAALEQHRLLHAERELLERTLNGTVELLTDLVKVAHPVAAARTEQILALIDSLAPGAGWELRIAARLGQVGLLAIPDEVALHVRPGERLTDELHDIYHSHPVLAGDLIRRIPRLERVADWIAAQPTEPDEPRKPAPGEDTPDRLIYDTVMAFIVGVEAGRTPAALSAQLAAGGQYPKPLLEAAVLAFAAAKVRRPRQVTGSKLTVGMLVNQDVTTSTGLTLLRAGEVVTESMAVRLRHFAEGVGLVEPIDVLV